MFSTIPELIADLKQGKMVIVMDSKARENEGDLIMAAAKVTPEHINFMLHYARGFICMPMPKAWCQHMQLPLMVPGEKNSKFQANFTLSVEAAKGVTTGVSTHDRALTIRAAASPNAKPEDLVRPGHVFPLMAGAEGVLERAGHTEASTDLVRLAGFNPAVAILCEIIADDGSMAREQELQAFAKKHEIKLGSIVDLIEYRLKNTETELA